MTSASTFLRSLIIYSLCLPLAVLLGYLLANPDLATFSVVGLLLFLLLTPLLLKWHHAWLVATWNMSVVFFFLPGHPQAWVLMAWLSLFVAIGHYILNRNLKFHAAPGVTRSLLLLVAVVLITAKCTGGIGIRSLGGDTYGGKRYVLLLSAIAGYFALTSTRVPAHRAVFFVGLFFLGALTQIIGDMGHVMPSGFYFLFLIFPVSSLQGIINDPGTSAPVMARMAGSAIASCAVLWLMLSRYSIADILTLRRPMRLLLFIGVIVASLFGGFRSLLMLFLLTFGLMFFLEGLYRSRLMPTLVLCSLFAAAMLVPFVDHLPLSVQRTLSFLPLQVDPIAKASAQSSTEWRVMIWKHLIPQIPEYLILGKGYGINVNDYEMVRMSRSEDSGAVGSELSGDYHNGPLSVVIPFGIFGTIAFVWFLVSSLRALYHNYQYGDPALKQINRFLFAFFLAKVLFFFGVFGSLYSDLAAFTGLIGLSLSLNGGVARQVVPARPTLAFNRFRIQPEDRKAYGVP